MIGESAKQPTVVRPHHFSHLLLPMRAQLLKLELQICEYIKAVMPPPAMIWPAVTFGLRAPSRNAFALLVCARSPNEAKAIIASPKRVFFILSPNRGAFARLRG